MLNLSRRKKNQKSANGTTTATPAKRSIRRPKRQRAMHNLAFILNFTIITGAIAGTLMSFSASALRPTQAPSPYSVVPVTNNAIPAATSRRPTTTNPLQITSLVLPKPHPLLNPIATPPAVSKSPPKKPEQAPTTTTKSKLTNWSTAEIARAQSSCRTVLGNLILTYEPATPMRNGACGDPSPIKVSRIGTNPGIEISPPAIMNCRFTARVAKWLNEHVQPAATKSLNSKVTTVKTMASYACRNRYGRAKARLSEHALANALDIGGFKLADGRTISVLSDWGPIQRRIKAAKLKTDSAKDTSSTAKTRWITKVATASPAALKGAAPDSSAAKPKELRPENQFLRSVHQTACKNFGTVLGPEANAAHENHFHLDLAPRRRRAYCE